MRVGFIGDPVIVSRGGRTWRYPPLHLLSEVPLAWRASAPGAAGDLYAGVVELDAGQVQTLLDRAQAAGIRLALVLDVDKADGTQPLSPAEKDRLTTWMGEKGLPAPGQFEAQLDYVQRLQTRLNASYPMDRTLADVETELGVMARQTK